MAKLSSRTEVNTANNADFIYIIQSDGEGSFISRRISKLNYIKELQAQVDALTSATIPTNLAEVANTTLRDALSPAVGNYVVVTNNADGQRTMDRYMFDTNADSNIWVTIGILPNIIQ